MEIIMTQQSATIHLVLIVNFYIQITQAFLDINVDLGNKIKGHSTLKLVLIWKATYSHLERTNKLTPRNTQIHYSKASFLMFLHKMFMQV